MRGSALFSLHSFLFILAFLLFSPVALLAKNFNDAEVMHIAYPDWFIDSPFLDLEEDVAKARSNGKQGLMILFTTEGCSYCNVFIRKSLGDPKLASVVQKNFASLGMEIFSDAEMTDPRGTAMPVKQFATQEGVQFSPTLLFYDNDGKRVLRAVGYQSPERFKTILSYVIGGHYRSESLRDYFARHTAPVSAGPGLKNDPLFARPPHALDRTRTAAKKPLLVIFEKRACDDCMAFHTDVLALKEVRAELKRFEIVRLDAADAKSTLRAPNGKRMTPAAWFEQADFNRVPALLFFDEKGNEVLKTDALVLRQRMLNSVHYVLERAYVKGWTYQRFARSKSIERNQRKRQSGASNQP